ncbi:gamma-glutamylcyclotransferase [Amphritea sp. 1_MG-2023]|nr:gamma-glutamylcyclotransferase [Amphritea sp. 1_MG-2023]
MQTVPGLQNFRLVRVPGYRRIFNKVGVVFLSRHGADPESAYLASCATQVSAVDAIICSQFECSVEQFSALYEREHRFRWIEVDVQPLETIALDKGLLKGRMCTEYSDDDYRLNKCITPQEYDARVGQYYDGALWRDDILPFPRYLAFCLQAATSQGAEVLANFLDSSYLADGSTTIRTYLQQSPELQNWDELDTGYHYPSDHR